MTKLVAQGCDPLLLNVELPLAARFYPLGFPLDVATNSCEVLDAARESWGLGTQQCDAAPITVRVVVTAGEEAAPEPAFRAQGHLTVIVSGTSAFAVCDRLTRFAFCFANARTAANRGWFRWYFLEPLVYQLLTQLHVAPVHAACVAWNGRGVLLCGPSGAGKSSLAFACARDGWEYVGDDATMLKLDGELTIGIGKPHQLRLREGASALFPELSEFEAKVRPNGKLGLEIATAAVKGVRTAGTCAIDRLVFLNRRPGIESRIEPVSGGMAVERLLRDLPEYEPEVSERHRRVIATLAALPAYDLFYSELADALPHLRCGVGGIRTGASPG